MGQVGLANWGLVFLGVNCALHAKVPPLQWVGHNYIIIYLILDNNYKIIIILLYSQILFYFNF